MTDLPSEFVSALAEIAHEAGRVVLRHFGGSTEARYKSDGSPVTAADEEAEALILARLAVLAPRVPVIAEEQMTRQSVLSPGARFFLVDPLDGTEEFLRGREEFTVNIALIDSGNPVCGTIIAPARNRAFAGERGKGAFEFPAAGETLDFTAARRICARKVPEKGPTVLVSRTHAHGEAQAFATPGAQIMATASSLKFGVLAAGEADLYPRRGPTMEWDTAAGQAVLEAAGGRMETETGEIFRYGKPGFRNPGFIARGAV
jgi:3'(2'), 5'-bisphosphate nucleotidase